MHVLSRLIIIAVVALGCWSESHASLDGQIEPQEIAMLPKYCPHTITFRSMLRGSKEEQDYWFQRLGPAFKSMHHYCWALISMQRAIRPGTTELQKRGHYRSAVDDINYVLRYVDDSFPLLPEILTRRGQALTKLKEYGQAEADFVRAAKLRADYWPAYTSLAESNIAQGRTDAARSVLQAGLTKVSEKRPLQRMLDDLKAQK